MILERQATKMKICHERKEVVESFIAETGGGLGYFIAEKFFLCDTAPMHDPQRSFHQNQPPSGSLGFGRIQFTGAPPDHTAAPYVRVPFKLIASQSATEVANISGQALLEFATCVWRLKRPKILISNQLLHSSLSLSGELC